MAQLMQKISDALLSQNVRERARAKTWALTAADEVFQESAKAAPLVIRSPCNEPAGAVDRRVCKLMVDDPGTDQDAKVYPIDLESLQKWLRVRFNCELFTAQTYIILNRLLVPLEVADFYYMMLKLRMMERLLARKEPAHKVLEAKVPYGYAYLDPPANSCNYNMMLTLALESHQLEKDVIDSFTSWRDYARSDRRFVSAPLKVPKPGSYGLFEYIPPKLASDCGFKVSLSADPPAYTPAESEDGPI